MNTEYKPSSPGMANTITAIANEVKNAYAGVMTIEKSPLKNFDPIVSHMVFQVLAFIWSSIFALMLGSYIAFGISATFHLLFVAGIFITLLAFNKGNKASMSIRSDGYNGRSLGGEHE